MHFGCLTRCLLGSSADNLCRQFGPKPGQTKCQPLSGSKLSDSPKYLTDRSKAVLLLWIFYVFVLSCVCYVSVHVCLYVLCGHLLGNGWPLGSRLWCLLWVCYFPIGILGQVCGSGVVLDCIDSWSLHPFLLYFTSTMVFLKEFFEKVDFKKNQQMTKKQAKLPRGQRV